MKIGWWNWGPSLAVTSQDLRVTNEDGRVLRITVRSDKHLGLMLGLQHIFNAHWQGQLKFREFRFNDLKIRQAGLSLACVF